MASGLGKHIWWTLWFLETSHSNDTRSNRAVVSPRYELMYEIGGLSGNSIDAEWYSSENEQIGKKKHGGNRLVVVVVGEVGRPA